VGEDRLVGPASGCPDGRWEDLGPTEMEDDPLARSRRRSYRAHLHGPMLRLLLEGKGREEVFDALERIAEEGLVDARTASELAEWILDGREPGDGEPAEETLDVFAAASGRYRALLDTVGECVHAERLVTGCCERQYLCHHPESEGRVEEPMDCSARCARFADRRAAAARSG
jgi:hypothetical protein